MKANHFRCGFFLATAALVPVAAFATPVPESVGAELPSDSAATVALAESPYAPLASALQWRTRADAFAMWVPGAAAPGHASVAADFMERGALLDPVTAPEEPPPAELVPKTRPGGEASPGEGEGADDHDLLPAARFAGQVTPGPQGSDDASPGETTSLYAFSGIPHPLTAALAALVGLGLVVARKDRPD